MRFVALNVLELFGGIGAFTQAVKSLDIPINVVDYVEINPYSVKSYNAINDTDFPPRDITQYHAHGKNVDVIMHGSPCFTADALVLTKDGYKKIIDIKVGDYVLTHENTFEKVVNWFDNGVKNVMTLKLDCAKPITLTPNHRCYVRTKTADDYTDPYWKEAKDLTSDDYIGYAINTEAIKARKAYDQIVDIIEKQGNKSIKEPIVVSDYIAALEFGYVLTCMLNKPFKIFETENGYAVSIDTCYADCLHIDGQCWYKVQSIAPVDTPEHVYDIEVENAHSFTVSGSIFHNCQDFSIAGKQKGGTEGSGTRSSLLYETIRIVEECKPKVVIWENVPNLVSSKFRHVFMDYVRKMIALGYRSYYKVLNAKDYGIPQNRERVFTVSILGEHKPYVFPEKEPLHLRLIDLLEKNVDESYYLSDKMIEKFTWTKNGYNNAVASQLNAAKRKNDQTSAETDVYKPRIRQIGSLNKGHQRDAVLDINGITGTLTSTDYKQPKSIAVPADGNLSDDIPTFDANGRVEVELKQVGQLYGTETEPNPQAGRVYDAEGLAPTMDTCSGGNRMPKIVEPVADCQQVGNVFGNDGKEHQSTAVYNVDGVAPTVCALANKGVIKVAEPLSIDSEDAVGCAIRNREDGEQLEFRKDNLVSALHGNIMKSMVATPEQPVAKRRVRRIGISSDNKSDTASAEINPQLVGGVGENDWNGQFHQGDRVYDANGIAVTLASQGGGIAGGSTALYAVADDESATTRIMEIEDTVIGGAKNLNTDAVTVSGNEPVIAVREATKFGRKMAGIGDSIDIAYVEQNRRRGRVQKGIAHTLVTSGNEQAVVVPADDNINPFIVASRGRNPENPSDRTVGVPTTQHLEANSQGLCNTLTTVQKDNYVCEPKNTMCFRIRKLTSRECFRLMGFPDECYDKVEKVVSSTRRYEQAGNSIVVNVLRRIVEQLLKSVEFERLMNNEQESEPSQN